MIPEVPPNSRAELEARVTAWLLGELSADEAAKVREQIEKDPELGRLRDRLSQTLNLLRETVATPIGETPAQPTPLKLSQEKREKLLASFKTVAPKEFTPPERKRISWLIPLAAAASLALLAGLFLPALSKTKYKSTRVMVLNELRMIDIAKQQWAEDKHQPAGAKPTMNDLVPYLGHGAAGEEPESIAGETYDIGIVGKMPVARLKDNKTITLPEGSWQLAADNQPAALGMTSPSGSPQIANEDASRNLLVQQSESRELPAPSSSGIVLPQTDGEKLAAAKVDNGSGFKKVAGDSLTGQNSFASDSSLDKQKSSTTPAVEATVNGSVDSLGLGGVSPKDEFASGQPVREAQLDVPTVSAPKLSLLPGHAAEALAERKDNRGPTILSPIPGAIESASASVASERVPNAGVIPDSPKDRVTSVDSTSADAKHMNSTDIDHADHATFQAALSTLFGKAGTQSQSVSTAPHLLSTRELAAGNTSGGAVVASNSEIARTPAPVAAPAAPPSVVVVDGSGQNQTMGWRNSDDLPLRQKLIPSPVPQPEVLTSTNAFTTFSLNVSDVAFRLAQASLENGQMPEAASMRSEEFINAFDYHDPEPAPGAPIGFAWERANDPFAHNRDFLRFSVKTAAQGRQEGRPLNLVLLLDKSGSMERADRVEIIANALRVLAKQLNRHDTLSVVVFARTARLFVDGVPGNQAGKIAKKLRSLTPEGGTNLEEAMKLAYEAALRHYLANGENRVVLLTDGAANLGNVEPEALKQKVEANRKQGIALDCFGVGWDGYNDDLLEKLSRAGGGRYGFVNTPEEAATEFAGKLAGALRVAAADVKVQVEFNPNRVTAYRQIGYAKDQLKKEDFRDNTVHAASIGAAESGNALYTVQINPAGEGPLGTVHVRFRIPGTSEYQEHEWTLPYTGTAVALDKASPAMRLIVTAAEFSEWLAGSPYAGEVTPDRLLNYLRGVPDVYGADARALKLEWMIRQAKSISGK